MNFGEIISDVEAIIDEINIQSNIQTWINRTYHDILGRSPFSFLQKNSTFSTTASTQTYSLASDARDILDMRQTDTPTVLTRLEPDYFDIKIPDPSSQSTDKPVYYIPFGRDSSNYLQVQLYPIPDNTYTIYYKYIKNVSDMTNTSTTPIIPIEFHSLLVQGSIVKGFAKLGKLTEMQTYMALYEGGIKRLVAFDKNNLDSSSGFMTQMEKRRHYTQIQFDPLSN